MMLPNRAASMSKSSGIATAASVSRLSRWASASAPFALSGMSWALPKRPRRVLERLPAMAPEKASSTRVAPVMTNQVLTS